VHVRSASTTLSRSCHYFVGIRAADYCDATPLTGTIEKLEAGVESLGSTCATNERVDRMDVLADQIVSALKRAVAAARTADGAGTGGVDGGCRGNACGSPTVEGTADGDLLLSAPGGGVHAKCSGGATADICNLGTTVQGVLDALGQLELE
jgi:hypothetical protein